MKKIIIPLIVVILMTTLFLACDTTPKPGKITLNTYADSLSYALGFIYGLDFANAPFEFDYKIVFKGMVNAQDENLEILTEDQIMDLLGIFQDYISDSIESEFDYLSDSIEGEFEYLPDDVEIESQTE